MAARFLDLSLTPKHAPLVEPPGRRIAELEARLRAVPMSRSLPPT